MKDLKNGSLNSHYEVVAERLPSLQRSTVKGARGLNLQPKTQTWHLAIAIRMKTWIREASAAGKGCLNDVFT